MCAGLGYGYRPCRSHMHPHNTLQRSRPKPMPLYGESRLYRVWHRGEFSGRRMQELTVEAACMICMRGGHYADMCPMGPGRAERRVDAEEKASASETDVAKSKQAKHTNDKRKQHELLTARMQVAHGAGPPLVWAPRSAGTVASESAAGLIAHRNAT